MSDKTSKDRQTQADVRGMMGRGGMRPGKIEKARDSRRALTRLALYLSPYKWILVFVLVMVLAYILLGLLEPYLIGRAIDKYISTKKINGLAPLAITLLIAYIFDNSFQAASAWTMAHISQDALRSLRRDLFERLQKLPIAFFDAHGAGELMSRLTNDIDAINQAVSQNVVSLIASVLSLVGIVVAMFALNPYLAVSTLIVVPIMFWFANFIAKYTRKGFRDLQRELGEINAVMEESISGQRVVKAFRRSETAIERFRASNEKVYKAGVYANTYALMLMPLTWALGNFFIIVLVSLGGYLALKNLATIGMIATFIGYAQGFLNPLRQLANMYNSIQAALAGAERAFEIIDTDAEVDNASDSPLPAPVRGAVRFSNVAFGYLPDTPIIKDMTLQAKAGQTIALVGPTGAGKTTIINLLTRFYEISSGSISIDGRDIRDISKDDLRRNLGIVLQDTFLFADTVMENIRYGRLDATDEECIQAAKLADADHFILQLPQGYQTKLSERASNLSQGQRQLLSIARAILADPSILILDEATSSVDTRTEARIQKSLLRLMEGRTSFVIAHRLSTIKDADNMIVINNGEIVEQGTHQQLLEAKGFFYKLYMSQFKGLAI
ncbi:MAG: multidrug ABC transporter ATP-binding protein [Anaerolineae bacterium UTCFX1]|jgi:ATP-binding cassette subfamily B protein|nr:MAG: multidrug ABC transporter ATP-binding protein [Anaerolineae bacterium UTCFX1]